MRDNKVCVWLTPEEIREIRENTAASLYSDLLVAEDDGDDSKTLGKLWKAQRATHGAEHIKLFGDNESSRAHVREVIHAHDTQVGLLRKIEALSRR